MKRSIQATVSGKQPYVQFSQRWWCRLPILLVSFLCLAGIVSSVLDDIDVVAFRDMRLRLEGNTHILDVHVVVRNSSQKAVQCVEGDFTIALVTATSEEIDLGTISHETILVPHNNPQKYADVEILFSIPLGTRSDVDDLYHAVLSTTQPLLTETEPSLSVHVQARFDLAVQSAKGWNSLKDVEIDWILTPSITPQILQDVLNALAPDSAMLMRYVLV